MRGDLGNAIRELKRGSGKGLLAGGVKLPLALAELGLIDEYEIVVQPRIAGRGRALFAGLSKPLDLKLVSRVELVRAPIQVLSNYENADGGTALPNYFGIAMHAVTGGAT